MRFALFCITTTLIYLNSFVCAREGSIAQYLQNSKNLEYQKFYESFPIHLRGFMQGGAVTLFLPTAKVIRDKYLKDDPSKSLQQFTERHFATKLIDEDSIKNEESKESYKSQLFFRKILRPDGKNYDYYVNDAKILNMDKVKKFSPESGEKQYLYFVDDLFYKNVAGSAMDFLRNPSASDIDSSVSAFKSRVDKAKLNDLYSGNGMNTFFIPVGGQETKNFNEIDKTVIHGHVIPGKALFIRPMGDTVYQTKESPGIKVELSLVNETDPVTGETILKVKSNTIISKADSSFPRKGVKLVEFVPDGMNIPVKNAIVHLIKEPLMVIDENIWDILLRESDGRLSDLMKCVEKSGMKNELEEGMERTLFAPSNDAFNMIPEDKQDKLIWNDEMKCRELINLHMIDKALTSYDVATDKDNKHIPSLDKPQILYFSVQGKDKNKTFTVEGGGVNATAVEADIGATNGIIHIINHVLGVPFKSISDKLKSDAKLSITENFGKGSKWNDIFKKKDRNFTFFVPNNEAWRLFEQDNPTTFKQLNLNGQFSDQIPKILSRHLILDKVLTRDDIANMSNVTTMSVDLSVLPFSFTNKNSVKRIDGTPDLFWEEAKIRAGIVRPDVKATNGIIHVINAVFMEREDIISGSACTTASIIATLIFTLIARVIV